MQLRLLRDSETRRHSGRASIASIVVHAAIVVVLLFVRRQTPPDPWFTLGTARDSLVDIVMVYVPPRADEPEPDVDEEAARRAEEDATANRRGGAAVPRLLEAPPGQPGPRIVAPPGPAPIARADSVGAEGPGPTGERARRFPIPDSPGVRFGDGSLWQEPIYIEGMDELMLEISGDVDLAARMQAIFDSVQAEPGAIERLPEWALTIPGFGGVGLNDRWIQLGPIKIPAAVLALLPLPQGNFEEGLRRRELAEQRRDLLLAAQRAATVETFKEEVRKIRERLQRERDLRRGGRRDSTAAINP